MASPSSAHHALLLLFYLACVCASTVSANTLVSGTVFCDQCLDGHLSLFDYPLSGAKVEITCAGGVTADCSTNWAGAWAVRFDGSPDLSGCQARVMAGPTGCGASVGPAKGLRLVFGMFGMELYAVGPMVAQPAKPKSFCPRATQPAQPPTHLPPQLSPPAKQPPFFHLRPPPPPPPAAPIIPLPPVIRPPMMPVTPLPRVIHPPKVPAMPPTAVSRRPPVPFFQASACPYFKWMMPQYTCHWTVVTPETPVALVFGPVAAGRYGTNTTLWDGLYGRGDLYRTLLREATTALLNSYHSIQFFYPTLTVISRMNMALLGSTRQALMVALQFRRANSGEAASGAGSVACNLIPCS